MARSSSVALAAALCLACGGSGDEAPPVPLVSPPAARTCLPGSGDQPGPLPERLSETGCFVDLPTLTPAPDLQYYDVASPLWSDGSTKHRYLVLPPGRPASLGLSRVVLPVGTVLIKVFSFDLAGDGTHEPRPLETRFLVLRDDGWERVTYRWDDDGLDATRLPADGAMGTYEVHDPAGDARPLTWFFPSQDTCDACHSEAAGLVLGVRIDQLNRDLRYEEGEENQLEAWARVGLLEGRVSADGLPRLDSPANDNRTAERRARSYLDANCAHCHRPGGWAPSTLGLDLRAGTPLSDTGLCAPTMFFTEAPRRISPGDPAASSVYRRMTSEGLDRMPPTGTRWVDPLAAEVVAEWIVGLPVCPDTSTP